MAKTHRQQFHLDSEPSCSTSGLPRKLNKKLAQAGALYEKSCCQAPDDQRRAAYYRQQAKSLAHKVLARQPDNLDALNLLEVIALDKGELQQAADFLEQGLKDAPDNIDLQYSRARLFLIAGDYDTAARWFTRVEQQAPGRTSALSSLAYTRVKQGLYVDAFNHYRDLIQRDAKQPHIRCKLFECIRHIQADCYCAELEQELLTYLSFTQVDHDDLAPLIASLLIHKYDLLEGRTPLDTRQLAQDPLLNQALRRCQFSDPTMEAFLTACRQCLLTEALGDTGLDAVMTEFAVSVSLQSCLNEFVYSVSLEEETLLTQVRRHLICSLSQADWQTRDIELPVLLVSMYELLHGTDFRNPLLSRPASAWSHGLTTLLQAHIGEPQQSLETQRDLEQLSAATPLTSPRQTQQHIQQAQDNPYPRWRSLNPATRTDYAQALLAELPGFTPPGFLFDQTIRILIAGCGTGRQAIQMARNFRNVEVTAIDPSVASLAHATEMARRHDINNIHFYQADMLDLDAITARFHSIECPGALNNIHNPLTGWRNLTRLLEPGGLIKTSLYSERARRAVTLARQLIVENNLTDSDAHIRLFRKALLDNLLGDNFADITAAKAFYNLRGCRDLLFHAQEHQFTPLHVQACTQELGLDFLGFVNLPTDIKQQYAERFADDPQRRNLTHWNTVETEQPALFQRMMTFYCQRGEPQMSHLEPRDTQD